MLSDTEHKIARAIEINDVVYVETLLQRHSLYCSLVTLVYHACKLRKTEIVKMLVPICAKTTILPAAVRVLINKNCPGAMRRHSPCPPEYKHWNVYVPRRFRASPVDDDYCLDRLFAEPPRVETAADRLSVKALIHALRMRGVVSLYSDRETEFITAARRLGEKPDVCDYPHISVAFPRLRHAVADIIAAGFPAETRVFLRIQYAGPANDISVHVRGARIYTCVADKVCMELLISQNVDDFLATLVIGSKSCGSMDTTLRLVYAEMNH